MRRLMTICVALAVLGVPAWAQKIETEKPDRGRIVHVQTALNHLTVIEVRRAGDDSGGREFRLQDRVAGKQGLYPANGT